jgi:hypothetical protein
MNIPGFTAEASLYKSTKGYAVAPNRTPLRGGAVVPALMNKLCWDKTTSTSKIWGLTFQTDCQICQWFTYTRICPQPPACSWGWVPAGDPWSDCISSLVAID